jgi:hypothetical protein
MEAHCWYILVRATGLRAGRAVDTARWATGRNTLAIDAIMKFENTINMDWRFLEGGEKKKTQMKKKQRCYKARVS